MIQGAHLVREHGTEAVSFHGLTGEFDYWSQGGQTTVAYREAGAAWVALGSPLGPREHVADVGRQFVAAAKAARKRASFFAVEQHSPLLSDASFRSLQVGSQPEWEPQQWPLALRRKRSLREQLRRARAKGVVITEQSLAALASDSRQREQLSRLAVRWQASKPMPPMKFAVSLQLFACADQRRIFCAHQNGILRAALIASPIGSSGPFAGWFIEDLLREPSTPNGTMESLFDRAMTTFADERVARVTMGLAPLINVRSKRLRAIRQLTPHLYDWHGLYRFKQKLQPNRWQRVYVVYPADSTATRTVIDSLRCFASGSFSLFGGATIRHHLARRSRSTLSEMAHLLVPARVRRGGN